MVAGRLAGSLNGRPVVIDADEFGLVLTFSTIRSLWSLRTIAGSLVPMLGVLKHSGIPVRMRIAGIVSVDVLPRPTALVRMFAPRLVDLP